MLQYNSIGGLSYMAKEIENCAVLTNILGSGEAYRNIGCYLEEYPYVFMLGDAAKTSEGLQVLKNIFYYCVLSTDNEAKKLSKLIYLPGNHDRQLYAYAVSKSAESKKYLESVPDIHKWNTSNIKDISYFFCHCSSLKSLPDISNLNTSNIIKTIPAYLIGVIPFFEILIPNVYICNKINGLKINGSFVLILYITPSSLK